MAYEDVLTKTSTRHVSWYVTPCNHKWFRNLAVSQIVTAAMEDLKMRMPKPHVDLDMIREEYHQAAEDDSRPKAKKKVKK
ncbi:MAG: hypothetical protein WA655_12050 [Candidatus Korobacteraceae bacterium]